MDDPDGPPVRLPRSFYQRASAEVAVDLLGALVSHRTEAGPVSVRLTEVEAYAGEDDPGSHAFRGRTPRTEVMYGRPGLVYVYFTYGMHWCMNLVCGPEGVASAVLLRAGEVVEGLPLARLRRPAAPVDRDLARGPARLTAALGISGVHNGADTLDDDGPLRVFRPDERLLATGRPPVTVGSGPRVGVGGAGAATPWRFWVAGDPTVSTYRAHTPKRRRTR